MRIAEVHGFVPGDLVILEAGDVVTADLRLAEASNLQADESVQTGESAPVIKTTGAATKDAALAALLGLPSPGLSGFVVAGCASLVPLALGQAWIWLAEPELPKAEKHEARR